MLSIEFHNETMLGYWYLPIILICTPPHTSKVFATPITTLLDIHVQEDVMAKTNVQHVNTSDPNWTVSIHIMTEKEVNINF